MRESRAVSAAYALALAQNRKSELAERSVARFICVSSFVRDVHLRAGFPAEKLVVKGHFLERLPAAAQEDDGTIIFVGRLSPEKGFALLLEALALLPDVTLKVVGEGPERARIDAALFARVRFLGQLPRDRVLEELRLSRLCVVPSLGSETFGLAGLEALAVGRPVVASDAGALPELIKHGENGWIVPRGDAKALAQRIRSLLEDSAAASAFGRAGRALIERCYLAGANIDQLERIYADAGAHVRTERH
jgi:glycosyltransferase involved in cell wall biosynthesis